MERIWIVVADGASATVWSGSNRARPLERVEDIDFPAGRLREQDVYSDRPGRTYESANDSRSAIEPPDIRDQQHHELARLVVDVLAKGRAENRFGRLALVAPPALLGALRHAMDPQLARLVQRTIHKNLVDADEARLRAYVFELPDE